MTLLEKLETIKEKVGSKDPVGDFSATPMPCRRAG